MLIETQRVTQENLPTFLDMLKGCWKSSSLLWMQLNGFSVLPGLILNGWEREAEEAVSRFSRERGITALLVRIEKPGQRWTRRRGGYTIPISKAHSLVDELAREGMVTILLQPESPYSDLYGLTSVCDLGTGKVDVEVVGPGFDASDILRSDTAPHERFEASFDLNVKRSGVQNLQIRRTHLVEPNTYRTSAKRRLTKIGARLRNPSYPEEVLQGASNLLGQQLRQEATQFLRAAGQTLLLHNLNEYQPISGDLLEPFLMQLLRLFRATAASRVPWQALSAAGSFLEQGRLVMWDFFSVGNQNTWLLSELRSTPMSL
jgi:hypothetical protein